MRKHLLVLLAMAGLIFINSGCTSQKTDDEKQVVENADTAKIEGDSGAVQAVDPSLDAALNEGAPVTADASTDITPPPPPDIAMQTTQPPATDASAVINNPATVSDGTATTTETTTMTTQDGMAPPVTHSTTTTTTADLPPPPPPESGELTETPITDPALVQSTLNEDPAANVKHVAHKSSRAHVSATPVSTAHKSSMKKFAEMVPYQGKNGAWINTIYVARPKEKLADISMKIFGTDKSADLKGIAENSYLKKRAVRAGDKIYYSSPNRPDDSAKMMLYYEDMGMVPETYVAKKGESLQKVSKKLLGYNTAWKEVWMSNIVESKTTLKDGETLRYWKEAEAAPTMAANSAPPPQSGSASLVDSTQAPPATATTTPPAATEATMAPPPPDNNAQQAMPPPPPADAQALPPPPADANANLPPPPPPPADAQALPPPPQEVAQTPPPPPPPEELAAPAAKKKKVNLDEEAAAEDQGGLSSDTLMSMGALGVLLVLLAFVIIRKKKQKAALQAQQEQVNDPEINA